MATLKEVIKVFGEMSLGLPYFTPKPGQVEYYYKHLADIPFDALQAGADICASNKGSFFPSAGDWRQACLDVMISKLNIPSAYEAWENVLAVGDGKPLIECTGERNAEGAFILKQTERVFAHSLIETTARQLGWPESFPGDNPEADRAHFYKAYESLVNREMEITRMLPSVRTVADRYALQAGTMVKQLAEGMRMK
jgi:hypothetical protein